MKTTVNMKKNLKMMKTLVLNMNMIHFKEKI